MKNIIFILLMMLPAVSCTDSKERLSDSVMKGDELYEARRYSEAMTAYAEAETMAKEVEDFHQLGHIYRKMAHTFNATGGYSEEIRYLELSADAYEKAAKPYNRLHVYFETGIARYNFQDYAAAEKIFRNTLFQAHEKKDTLLEAECLQVYAGLCLEQVRQDPVLAVNMLSRVANELKCELSCEDKGMLAYAYALMGNDKAAASWLNQAMGMVQTPAELAKMKFREYQVNSLAGRDADALRALEMVMEHTNSVELSSLRHSVASARREYQDQQHELTRSRLSKVRLTIAFVSLFLMSIIFALAGYMRYRKLETARLLAERKAETERLMSVAEELQTRLKHAFRSDLLEKLCEQYYIYEGTDNLQGKVLKEVKNVIDGLRDDPKVFKGLEKMLDDNFNGLTRRIREQLPKLKADDYRLFVFAACGFSSTTISTIIGKEKSIIYNRIWRLKGKITSSDARDKADFLKSITY